MLNNEVVCSLLDEEIVIKCKDCPLMEICNDIDSNVREYNEDITTIFKTFKF